MLQFFRPQSVFDLAPPIVAALQRDKVVPDREVLLLKPPSQVGREILPVVPGIRNERSALRLASHDNCPIYLRSVYSRFASLQRRGGGRRWPRGGRASERAQRQTASNRRMSFGDLSRGPDDATGSAGKIASGASQRVAAAPLEAEKADPSLVEVASSPKGRILPSQVPNELLRWTLRDEALTTAEFDPPPWRQSDRRWGC